MSDKRDVGEISVSSKGVHWTIPNFSQLPQIHNTKISSPLFEFEKRGWYLRIYPNGYSSYSSLNWFGIDACSYTPFRANEYDIHLSIADKHGRSIVSSRAKWDVCFYTCYRLIPHAEFQSRKSEFMPNGTLRILLTIENEEPESTFHADVNKVKDGKKRLDDASKDVSTQTEEGVGVWTLKEDLEKLLQNENITDLSLKMQGQEFRAHRCILAARSPVFLAMMTHDTKEKNTGVIDIEDVDLNAIPDFLRYLYTGNVNNLTSEKALKLYSIADKYQVIELKQNCLNHLMTNISAENFCDVISLSLQHNEKDLKEASIDYFQENSLDIVVTTNWQTFLTENPIIGNELFIKHLQLIKSILQEAGKEIRVKKDDDKS